MSVDICGIDNIRVPEKRYCLGNLGIIDSLLVTDDLKSGQAKLKPVLTEFLVHAGIKPLSIASYNCARQNNFVPGVIELTEQHNGFIGGDNLKSVLAEFFVNAGIKPLSIASYNHMSLPLDSLLANPLILDLSILAELLNRIQYHEVSKDKDLDLGSFYI
ncbi:hypothetical protein M422DRAFT_271830 [Sphaerobolus stellatus SS14]|uniref:Inositol-3-phosphate synthase n=1 Tax=Sphaerobolus stellatus (strain SS14) TaxID=990650 RepID=A0A0C9UCZ7_SPHS4|nr:hypothetical protein M422DRAFT_271830 [Sphaerobolus stellatus SS14]